MNDPFAKRVQAAAIAGWWTLLVAIAFLMLQWLAYIWIMSTKPAWLLPMFGPAVSWSYLQSIWFSAAMTFKLCVWLLALLVVWLTFWAVHLEKMK